MTASPARSLRSSSSFSEVGNIATAYWIAGSVLASKALRSADSHFIRSSRLPSLLALIRSSAASTAFASLPPIHASIAAIRWSAGRAMYCISQ